MLGLLLVHLFEDGAAAHVSLRQALEVAFEMFAHLPLSLGDEAETPAIAERATGGADRESARVPEWAEPARCRTELGQALFAGQIAPFPVFAQVGTRLTPEGGGDVPTTWTAPPD